MNSLLMVGWLTARIKYFMHIQDDEMNAAKLHSLIIWCVSYFNENTLSMKYSFGPGTNNFNVMHQLVLLVYNVVCAMKCLPKESTIGAKLQHYY
jgi:hypothetical protein